MRTNREDEGRYTRPAQPAEDQAVAGGLNVAFFCEHFPVVSEAFIASSAAALINAGHAVQIYAMEGHLAGETERQPHVTSHRLEERLRFPAVTGGGLGAALSGAPGALVDLWRQRGVRAVRALDPLIFRRSAINLRSLYLAAMIDASRDYDILHCQFGHLAHDVLRLRRAGFLSGKVIVHFRGYDITKIPEAAGPGYYDEVFRSADWFIANSNFFRDRAVALGAPQARISVSYSGIDLANFPFRAPVIWTPGEPLRLMTVGRLVEKKGIHFALEVVARLKACGMTLHYDIVGDGPDRGRLEAAARGLGIDHEVRFHGARGHAFIRSLLDEAHLFLAPSVTASNKNADAPINTLKEAMAAGVPVVSTRHGGIPELVDDGESGFLCDEGSTSALYQRVEEALQMSDRWPQIAEAARIKVANQFDLARTTDSLLRIYQEALNS